jgi:hypothetical protein
VVANHNFVIAATLLGVALVLVAAELAFVANDPDGLAAAENAAAIGIIAP